MAKSDYFKKFKDPRWQKKRLKIMERNHFQCQWVYCLSTTNPLNVHHLIYLKDRDPWDYDDSFLITLCESCHKNIGNVNIKDMIIEHLIIHGVDDRFNFFMKFPLIVIAHLVKYSGKEIFTILEFYDYYIDSDNAEMLLYQYGG